MEILLNGVKLNELLEKIGQLIDSKIGKRNNQPQTENQAKFISRHDVATILKISLPTLNDWTKSGLLQSYRIGTRVLYKLREVEEAIKLRDFKKFQRGGNCHA